MEEKFLLSVFHPDEAKSYLFETYIDLKDIGKIKI